MQKNLFLILTLITSICFGNTNLTVIPDECFLQIKSPSLSSRTQKKLRLENGLEVLVISDPEANQSSASFAVNVGQWNDPEEYPGCAHFLEHLLFLGTKAYPKEDGFMSFVRDHGGLINAYTAFDRTVYAFSISNDLFENALDQFSHFFIDPLFSSNGIERELNAVDQEHKKNLSNDGRRWLMVLKSLANPNHPFSRFSSGNAETLGSIPREKVIQWFHKYYGANRSKLVVYSNKDLATLENWISTYFSSIPYNGSQIKGIQEELFSNESKGKLIVQKPLQHERSLSILWELPKEFAIDQEFQTAELLAFMLNKRTQGSLSQVLKDDGLIENIQFHAYSFSTKQKLFIVDVDLTDLGAKNYSLVLEKLFANLELAQKQHYPPFLYQEYIKVMTLQYSYQSRRDPFEFAMSSSSDLINESIRTYPQKTLLPSAYHPLRTHQLLQHLKPEESIVSLIMDPKYVNLQLNKKEPWYSVEYTSIPLNELLVEKCNQPTVDPRLKIPEQNPLIPSKIELASWDEDMSAPKLLISDLQMQAYYYTHSRYQDPKSCYLLNILSPKLDGSKEAHVYATLLSKILSDQLLDLLTHASDAGIALSASIQADSISLSANGFSENLELGLNKALEQLLTLSFSKQDFQKAKNWIQDLLQNSLEKTPLTPAIEKLKRLSFTNEWTTEELLVKLEETTFSKLQEFHSQLLDKSYLYAIAGGNLTEEKAFQNLKKIARSFNSKHYTFDEQKKAMARIFPSQLGPIQLKHKTPRQGNAFILSVQLGEDTDETRAGSMIINQALNSDYFEELRTKQQTGYIVGSVLQNKYHMLSQNFYIQSTTHTPIELLSRTELFLEQRIKLFDEHFTQKRFEGIKASLIDELKKPEKTLAAECDSFLNLAIFHQGDFNRRQRTIEAIENFSYEELKAFYKKHFSRENTKRIAILVDGTFSHEFKPFSYEVVQLDEFEKQAETLAWN